MSAATTLTQRLEGWAFEPHENGKPITAHYYVRREGVRRYEQTLCGQNMERKVKGELVARRMKEWTVHEHLGRVLLCEKCKRDVTQLPPPE